MISLIWREQYVIDLREGVVHMILALLQQAAEAQNESGGEDSPLRSMLLMGAIGAVLVFLGFIRIRYWIRRIKNL